MYNQDFLPLSVKEEWVENWCAIIENIYQRKKNRIKDRWVMEGKDLLEQSP